MNRKNNRRISTKASFITFQLFLKLLIFFSLYLFILKTFVGNYERASNKKTGENVGLSIAQRSSEHEKTFVANKLRETIDEFYSGLSVKDFSSQNIQNAFFEQNNDIRKHSVLIHIYNGTIDVEETRLLRKYKKGRLPSLKYILHNFLNDSITPEDEICFIVNLNDGSYPQVPTFGSARHWKTWRYLIPVPLGNERGVSEGSMWSTPIKGWDNHVRKIVKISNEKYKWDEKRSQAVFRGRLTMTRHKLGTCNEENEWNCEPAESWKEVNRGILYLRSMKHKRLFDVGFTEKRGLIENKEPSMIPIPPDADAIEFLDFQKYKVVINVGNNHGECYEQ